MKKNGVAVFLAIAMAILFASEIHAVRVSDVTGKITSQIKTINDNEKAPETDNAFVYLNSKNVLYTTLVDNDFGLMINAAYFQRHVEFCQWTETKKKERSGDQEVTRFTYSKTWVPEQVDSLMFNEPEDHMNPKFQTITDTMVTGLIKVGAYDISKNLTKIGEPVRFIPTMQQLKSFTGSRMQQFYRYIGNGVFYHEYQQGATPIFLNYFGYNVNGELPKHAIEDLFDTCNTGDVRVIFKYWGPPELSVVGYRSGNEIQKHEYDGVDIGSLAEGKVSVKDMIESHKSSSIALLWFARILYSVAALVALLQSSGKKNIVPILFAVIIVYMTNSAGFYKLFQSSFAVFLGALVSGLITVLSYNMIEGGKKKVD